MTKMMKDIVSWWQSEHSFFPKVETLLILSTILFAIQVVFGWWRRCSSSLFIKYSLWLAYTCTPLVATYTLGFMSTFIYSGDNYLMAISGLYLFVWSFSLLFALGSTYSMTAYDVDDNKQYMRHLVRNALYVLNMVGITRFFPDPKLTLLSRQGLLLYLLFPLSILSTVTNMMASSSSDSISLYLQDYMKKEHLLESPNRYDPVTLEGYNYLIFFNTNPNNNRNNKDKDITVSQVWLSNRGLLGRSGSDSTRLKEVSLSFALSHLLQRRFFGAACPEAKLQKTHDLVFRGLLSSSVEENNMMLSPLNEIRSREKEENSLLFAYRVIEMELAFVHDHFFMTSPTFGYLIVLFAIMKVAVYLWHFIIQSLNLPVTSSSSSSSSLNEDGFIITAIIMMALSALELLQLYIYLTSNFAKVLLACCTITPSKCGIWFHILRVCGKLPQLFGCWQNKIGQHSLLKDLHSRSIAADVMGSLSWAITFCILPSNFMPSAFPRGICNPGIKGPDHTMLTDPVKKAIARTLQNSDGHLSNGKSSLERNGQVQLSQEFLLGSHASDLLIWHIATEYCDMAQCLQDVAVPQDDFASNHDIAAILSSYCAYLMAFVPELLPDHQLETTAMFHRARKEALKHLHGDTSLKEKYTKLRNYGQPSQSQKDVNPSDGDGQPPPPPPPHNGDMNNGQRPQENENMTDDGQLPPQDGNIQDVNVFEKGIQLGKRLEGIPDNGTRWKILADFWTEMILYIAPSNNAREHIQHLANGGEFITHLWALLTHAGILERPPRNVVSVQDATEVADKPHENHAHGLQREPPHTEDTENAVNLHEIEEADRGNLPDQGNNDSNASTSIDHRP